MSPDQDTPAKAVGRAQQERQLVDVRLTAARHRLLGLHQARQPHDQLRLGAILRGEEVAAEVVAKVEDFDRQIRAVEAEIRPLMNECARLDAELMTLRSAASAAQTRAIHVRADELYADVAAELERLREVARPLAALHARHPGLVRSLVDVPTVERWLKAARMVARKDDSAA
jgi:chromosome segregation ATPase